MLTSFNKSGFSLHNYSLKSFFTLLSYFFILNTPITTSLTESRYILGSEDLSNNLSNRKIKHMK